MVMRSTITSKGQTTIPNQIRKQMDLKPGDGLVYRIEGNEILVRPVKGNLLDAYGTVKPKQRPEDFAERRRQARKRRAVKVKGKQ